ncbi:DNA polymerase III subunit beta [Candidatus Saccharibacteria bacterium]|nr:DNA polymerase III subunit beta [Candidatus Saccharibacteria bacterium]
MRIQITQSNLHKALTLLSRVASTKSPLPILSNILLTAHKGSLELAATNLEVAITHTARGKVDQEGSVTVPARLFTDFISQLPKNETIELVFEKNKLFITAGSYSSHIQGIAADEFPALPTISSKETLTVSTKSLQQALTRTMLAASHDDTRPVLGGVLFHTIDKEVYIAATDGYRLAESQIGCQSEIQKSIVPTSTLQDVQKILQDTSEESVTLQFEDGQFGLLCEDTILVSRLIEGQYPEYSQLIPETSEISATIAREELSTAAKLAGLFARESGGSITLKASENDGNLVVSSVASQVGDNTSSITGKISGSGEVVVNVRYLTDALNCFEGDTVTFRFSGAISPCVLTSETQPGYQHIVMPLKS